MCHFFFNEKKVDRNFFYFLNWQTTKKYFKKMLFFSLFFHYIFLRVVKCKAKIFLKNSVIKGFFKMW